MESFDYICAGHYLNVENVKDIITFCHREGLVLFTDEVRNNDLLIILICLRMLMQVYQENIYIEGVQFQSFHKVLHSMGSEVSDIQMVSFNSTSKGYFGE